MNLFLKFLLDLNGRRLFAYMFLCFSHRLKNVLPFREN